MVLEVDPERLPFAIRVENLEGGSEPFPHMYGALPTEAGVATFPVTVQRGRFLCRVASRAVVDDGCWGKGSTKTASGAFGALSESTDFARVRGAGVSRRNGSGDSFSS